MCDSLKARSGSTTKEIIISQSDRDA